MSPPSAACIRISRRFDHPPDGIILSTVRIAKARVFKAAFEQKISGFLQFPLGNLGLYGGEVDVTDRVASDFDAFTTAFDQLGLGHQRLMSTIPFVGPTEQAGHGENGSAVSVFNEAGKSVGLKIGIAVIKGDGDTPGRLLAGFSWADRLVAH